MNKDRDFTVKDGFVLFWGSVFSQWHPSQFVIGGVTYNCAEQWMMAEKARMFKDSDARSRIMRETSPASQKRLGRGVKNFDEHKWQKDCREIVFQGNLAKFSQNDDLKEVLLGTGEMTIVEASPTDRIWGIGLREDDPRATVRSAWRGKNWLGEAIMRARQSLRESPVTP